MRHLNASIVSEMLKAIIAFFSAGIGATIALLMPGYLLNLAYNRNRRGPSLSEREFVAGSAVGAIVVHTLALAWTLPLITAIVKYGPTGREWQIALWTLAVLIVIPTVLGAGLGALTALQRPALLRLLLTRLGLSPAARIPQAWDWVFSRGFPAYVRVGLTDGRTVYGLYSAQSFASSDSGSRDLYLQQHWTQDAGWFSGPYPQTMGIWLSGEAIMSIEFYDGRPAATGEGGTDESPE
jgi:hypothetical protein